MERYHDGRRNHTLGILLGILCVAAGVPLFMSEALKADHLAGLRVLCGLMGMTGLILTPFAILTRCFDHWDRYK